MQGLNSNIRIKSVGNNMNEPVDGASGIPDGHANGCSLVISNESNGDSSSNVSATRCATQSNLSENGEGRTNFRVK
jgi:hypothetical protein